MKRGPKCELATELPEENIEDFCDLGLGREFLWQDTKSTMHSRKTYKLNSIKIRNFYSFTLWRSQLRGWKDKAETWRKYFQVTYIPDKALKSGLYKELPKFNIKKPTQLKKMAPIQTYRLPKTHGTQIAHERCSGSLLMRETQTKATVRYHYSWNAKTDHSKCQWACTVPTTLTLPATMSTVTRSTPASKHGTWCDSAIPFSRDRKARARVKTWTQVLTVALLTLRYKEQPRCPPTTDGIDRLWCSHTVQCCAIQKGTVNIGPNTESQNNYIE